MGEWTLDPGAGMTALLPDSVVIREVGPRDGLQPELPVPVRDRVRLIDSLLDAGVTRIEAAAFVSPRAVPSMAGAAEVLAAVVRRPGVTFASLVPNLRGAELALAAGVDELTVTISISEIYNQRNVSMSTAESADVIAQICATSPEVPVDAVVSCAFGSPYEGEVDPGDVEALAARLRNVGCAAITLADTTGMATPRRVVELLNVTGSAVGLHLHDTRGTAMVNAYAAMQHGVSRFDTSVGGLGGSPFADGAAGNLATEDLVAMLDDLGVQTGIQIDGVIAAAALAGELVGRPVPGRVAGAGPRTRRAE